MKQDILLNSFLLKTQKADNWFLKISIPMTGTLDIVVPMIRKVMVYSKPIALRSAMNNCITLYITQKENL
jgi:hypothetical protein